MESRAVYIVASLLVGALAAPQPEVQRSIEDSEVGHLFSNTRIVGGEEAPEGSVPWMVGMSTGIFVRSFVCGASLISSRHIMTAAHCIDAVWSGSLLGSGSLQSSLRIHVGSNRWRSGDTRYSLAGNLTHPNYLSSTIKNDIGFLITDEDVEFTATVSAIPLSFDHIDGGVEVMVSGWGRERAGGSLPSNLKRAFLYTLDGEDCVKNVQEYANANNFNSVLPVEPHIELCTFHSVGQGTCNGDSGSALIEVSTNKQVGVVSWGFPCAIGAPDMFARVSGFQDFILEAQKVIL